MIFTARAILLCGTA